jgi:hypothetical protein
MFWGRAVVLVVLVVVVVLRAWRNLKTNLHTIKEVGCGTPRYCGRPRLLVHFRLLSFTQAFRAMVVHTQTTVIPMSHSPPHRTEHIKTLCLPCNYLGEFQTSDGAESYRAIWLHVSYSIEVHTTKPGICDPPMCLCRKFTYWRADIDQDTTTTTRSYKV